MHRVVAILLILFVVWIDSKAQHFTEDNIRKFMADGHVYGMFIAVVKENNVLYRGSYGVADFTDPKPVNGYTCFELGSISKAFTADLIYELHHKKLLNVNDPLTKYFKDAPQTWSRIKVLHLLNHTSGIQNYLLDPRFHAAAYFTGNGNSESEKFFATLSTDSMVKMFYSLRLEFPSGSNWAYSNTGYILLGKIAEKVTGRPFFEQVGKKLSASLEMHQTRANEIAAAQGCLKQGYAVNESRLRNADILTSTYAFSAGAWATTGNDMINYLKAVHRKILPVDSTDHKWRELSSTSDLPLTYHGGRFYTTYHGLKVIFHNGGTPGYSSSWIYVPEKKISIVILMNRQDYAPIDRLAWDILASYEPALKFPELKLTTTKANKFTQVAEQFLQALKNNAKYPETFSKTLGNFLESENGKGLWRWIFERGMPTKAICVDEEAIGLRKAYRFVLPFSDKIDYRLTAIVNQSDEVVQLLWY